MSAEKNTQVWQDERKKKKSNTREENVPVDVLGFNVRYDNGLGSLDLVRIDFLEEDVNLGSPPFKHLGFLPERRVSLDKEGPEDGRDVARHGGRLGEEGMFRDFTRQGEATRVGKREDDRGKFGHCREKGSV